MASTISAGSHRHEPAQDQRDRAVDEALHDDLAGVGADARGREPGGQQRQREGQRGAVADERLEARVRALDRVDVGSPESWNSDAATTSIDMLTTPATPIAIEHVDALEAQQPALARASSAP